MAKPVAHSSAQKQVLLEQLSEEKFEEFLARSIPSDDKELIHATKAPIDLKGLHVLMGIYSGIYDDNGKPSKEGTNLRVGGVLILFAIWIASKRDRLSSRG